MKIKVTTQNGTQEVPFLQDTTVLESLEQANIPAEYHCEGFCGACRCKLTSGEVEYVIDPLPSLMMMKCYRALSVLNQILKSIPLGNDWLYLTQQYLSTDP